jgi:hypothetical protein
MTKSKTAVRLRRNPLSFELRHLFVILNDVPRLRSE